MRLSLLCLFVAVACPTTRSAEINFFQGPEGFEGVNAIVIDGEIVAGDYERFLAATLKGGFDRGRVFISSPGGSVAESIKIGSLIRSLAFSTEVPFHPDTKQPTPPFCDDYEVNSCTCVSACLLIFVGGVERIGNYLSVHRTFLDHDVLRDMSIHEASAYSNGADAMVRSYLSSMSVPDSLHEIMGSVPSNESVVLPGDYVHEHFFGPAANVEEWIIARCGNWESVASEVYNSTDTAIRSVARSELDKISDCKFEAYAQERRRVFTESILDALKAADDRYLSTELRQLKRHAHNFDISSFIGRPAAESISLIKLLGYGQSNALSIATLLERGEVVGTRENITFGGDSEGSLWSVSIGFWEIESESMVRTSYKGFFAPGLSRNSRPVDVIRVFGQPVGALRNRIVEDSPGVTKALFRTDGSDIEVTFEPDVQSLRAIEFYPRGYFDESAFSKYLY